MPLTLQDLFRQTDTVESCLLFCYQHQLLKTVRGNCPRCNSVLRLYVDRSRPSGHRFRCSNRRRGRQGCSYSVSAHGGSWFDNIKLSLQKAILIPYFWVYKYSQIQLRHELQIGSSHTSADWNNFVRAFVLKL